MVDQNANFAWGTILTPPSPTTTGTSFVLNSGQGSRFPNPSGSNYNVIIKAAGERPLLSNSEIVRVTAKTSDTFTITREQESTTARDIQVGDEVYIAFTKKTRDDIQTEIDAADAAIVVVASALTTHEADTANPHAVGLSELSDFSADTNPITNVVDPTDAQDAATKNYVDETIATEIAAVGDWKTASGTWTYASWTSGTRIGTITVPTDATTVYQPGMRIKITQSTGGTKYGIIQKVEATTLTVFFKNSTTLNNETISTPYYSSVKVPFGFDASPAQWLLETLITTDVSIESGTTYANTGSISLSVGIGAWIKEYKVHTHIDGNATTEIGGYVTLSTANNSESDQEMTSMNRIFTNQSAGDLQLYQHVHARKYVEVTAAETWYLNAKGFSGVTYGVYEILGSTLKSYVRAHNAYL